MFRFVKPPLEPAEFYYWHDGRDDTHYLVSRRQYDPDPEASAAIGRESAARMLALHPDDVPTQSDIYFEEPTAEIGPDLVVRASAFKGRKPATLPHYDEIINQTDLHHRDFRYRVVSTAWKEAIESLEPGIHQFFPHELRFADGNVLDRFIIRERQDPDTQVVHSPDFTLKMISDHFDRIIGYSLVNGMNREPVNVTLDLDRVAGRHWVREPSTKRIFVSRALAEKLDPLLPNFTALIPVALTGAEPSSAQPDFQRSGQHAEISAERLEKFDPKLAAALKTLSQPFSFEKEKVRDKALKLIEKRLAKGNAAFAFEIMETAIEIDGPLRDNMAFQSACVACHELPEDEVLAYATPWARDPNPLKRVAAARALSRPEYENPDTFDTLTGLLDDPDPLVVDLAIMYIGGTHNSDYENELRAREDTLANHPDEVVRDTYRVFIPSEDGEMSEEERELRDSLKDAGIAELFEAVYKCQCISIDRSGKTGCIPADQELEVSLDMLRKYEEQPVAQGALAWARSEDPVRRLVAAKALKRESGPDGPSADAIEALHLLVADTDKEVVIAVLGSFLEMSRSTFESYELPPGEVEPPELAPVRHCETHAEPDVRKKYAEILANLGSSDSTAGLPIVRRMAKNDPSDDVRSEAASHLRFWYGFLDHDKVGRKAVRQALADLLEDRCGRVRVWAIEGLSEAGDKRAPEAIMAELGVEVTGEQEIEETGAHLASMMDAILERPKRRYLPALQRWQSLYPHPSFEEAIEECSEV